MTLSFSPILRLLTVAAIAFTASQIHADPLPKEVTDAVTKLPTADENGRKQIYTLLADKGDARLIPLLQAFRAASLQLRDGRFIIYGERVNVPGQGSMLPLLDGLTGEPIPGPDGKPSYVAKADLSKAIKSPPRSEARAIIDLISSLSLLAPDPETRIASIRDAGERANRAFVKPEEQKKILDLLDACAQAIRAAKPASADEALAAINAAKAEKPANIITPAPSDSAMGKVVTALGKIQSSLPAPSTAPTTVSTTVSTTMPAASDLRATLTATLTAARAYRDLLDTQVKALDDVTKTAPALHKQLEKDPNGKFAPALRESIASADLVIGDRAAQLKAVQTLGEISSSRAANLLQKWLDAARGRGDTEFETAAAPALSKVEGYQGRVHMVQNTFAGLSQGSILVLLALGLSIVFGLMGVINMAHGEFMMIGAFTTYVVASWFRLLPAAYYNYYLLAAIPAAFIVAGLVGFICESLIIRHLYGRPLETLLATYGLGLVLIWFVKWKFGNNLSIKPPTWMEGGVEVATDIVFPLNRVYIFAFCVICIVLANWVVNRTKFGLLLRATTQHREMAAALGVATRRVDGLTFALGCGLAGLAGVAVPLYDKINPNIGQDYIVDSFLVVVVGGVGKLAGAVIAGFGLGFIGKYLEPLFQHVSFLKSGASVIGKVVVLGMVIVFLQYRPSGLFPPKGRNADA